MSEEFNIENAKVMIALVRAQQDLIRDTAKQDVWGAKLLRTINNACVFIAGSLVALMIALGAICGIVWLFVQMKHLIGS